MLTPYQMYQQICSPILWVVFLFCWWFSLPCKNSLVWCNPICLFLLLFPLSGEIYLIKHSYEQHLRLCCQCFLLGFLWFQVPLSFNCPYYWISSQVTCPSWWRCGTRSSQFTSYPFRTPSVKNSRIVPEKSPKWIYWPHPAHVFMPQLITRARHMGCPDGPGLCARPPPTVGSTTRTPNTETMGILLSREEGELGAKQAETADVPSKYQLCPK